MATETPAEFLPLHRQAWLLERRTVYLNHGSFGACPRAVLYAQAEWRRRLETQPVAFMTGELPAALRHAASELARALGARGGDLVFVDNATSGVNTVLNAIPWRRGDAIVVADQAYPAVRNAVRHTAARHGLKVREALLPVPLPGPGAVTAAFDRAIGKGARLVVVDHVSSQLAAVFPVAEVAALAHARGARVLVDGAHAPGMLALRLPASGADWYTGNAHKWLCAPKGCAFLWARPEAWEGVHPLVVSNHYGAGHVAEFDWVGTRDPSAWLAVTAALEFMRACGGLARIRARNRRLLLAGLDLVARACGARPVAPPAMLGSMGTLLLPGARPASLDGAAALHDELLARHRVELPVFPLAGRLALRLSAQLYNGLDDYRKLATALPRLL